MSAACTNAYEGRTSRSLNTHLRASASAWGSPPAAALTTICAMAPTMAAVELLSAPPDNGSRYPLAPLQQWYIRSGTAECIFQLKQCSVPLLAAAAR